MQRTIEHIRRYFAGTPRVFAAALAMVALSMSLYSMVFTLNVVTVTDGEGEERVLLTAEGEPEAIIELAGLVAEHADEVVYTMHSENTASIVIRRAFEVTLVDGEESFTAEFVEGTVQDLMDRAGLVLEGEDSVEPGPGAHLTEDMTVQVMRVGYDEELLREELDETAVNEWLDSRGIAADEFKWSNADQYDVVYRHRYVNGERESSEILALSAVILPRAEGSTEFINGVPCSRVDFEDITIGEDGIPTEYAWAIEGAVATAYSSSGGRGASGLGLYCGTVAVDPSRIPYGTRMWITTADNSFVYGYAIATDTGSAMREGKVDIDLYFDTNAECLRFGKRTLNVYILEDEPV